MAPWLFLKANTIKTEWFLLVHWIAHYLPDVRPTLINADDDGADISYIQMILGHVSLTTTQIYTQVSIKKLKEVHESTHPAR